MEIVLREFFKVLPDFVNFFQCFNFRSLVAFNVCVVKKGHQCLLLIHKRFPDDTRLHTWVKDKTRKFYKSKQIRSHQLIKTNLGNQACA